MRYLFLLIFSFSVAGSNMDTIMGSRSDPYEYLNIDFAYHCAILDMASALDSSIGSALLQGIPVIIIDDDTLSCEEFQDRIYSDTSLSKFYQIQVQSFITSAHYMAYSMICALEGCSDIPKYMKITEELMERLKVEDLEKEELFLYTLKLCHEVEENPQLLKSSKNASE